MFLHNYKYRLICVFKDKQVLFWTLLFPILLSTLFNLAFSNLSSTESFSKINIAIVNNTEFQNNPDFMKAINGASSSDKTSIFSVKYTTKQSADKLLENNKIDGYIFFNNGMKLIVKKSGLNQTILRSFMDDYAQTSSTIMTIVSKNPVVDQKSIINSVINRTDFLKETPISKSAPNTTVNYFYTLIALACLYGSFWGMKEVVAIQADLSPEGARINMAPTNKLKVFVISTLAAATIQIFEIFVLLLFMIFVLKVDFGSQIGYIVLTCIIGSITGVTFGTCVASVVKKGEGLKISVLISLTMMMSFLSGMMFSDMKYIISTNIPILGYINPAALITDSFYSLYYYNTHTQFFTDIIGLCCITVVFSIITYLIIRRQKYASL